ncbi:MAG: hypothetical protein QXI09_00935 [Candidatus Aenigmatarchaeota archaeon]
MAKKLKERKHIRFIEILLILIGAAIILISLLSWTPKETSELMFRVNFLSFAIGILYIVFAFILRKIKD